MADKKVFKVTAALVPVKLSNGLVQHVYAGGTVPDGATNLDELVEGGFVAADKDTDVVPVVGVSPPALEPHRTIPANDRPARKG